MVAAAVSTGNGNENDKEDKDEDEDEEVGEDNDVDLNRSIITTLKGSKDGITMKFPHDRRTDRRVKGKGREGNPNRKNGYFLLTYNHISFCVVVVVVVIAFFCFGTEKKIWGKVKHLRKLVLASALQLSNVDSDKNAKKKFKKSVQELEERGIVSLNEEGIVTLVVKKKKKKNDKREKKEKKNKKRKRKRDDDESNRKKRNNIDEGGGDSDTGDDNSNNNTSTPSEQERSLKESFITRTKKKLSQEEQDEQEKKHETVDENENENKSNKTKRKKGNPSGITRLFLGNLPFAVDEQSLASFLSPAVMTHVRWITDKETGKFYGSSFVEMANASDAAIAVSKSSSKLMGRPIKINYAPSRPGDEWPPATKVMTGGGGGGGGGRRQAAAAGGKGLKAMSEKPLNCTKLFLGNVSFDIDDDGISKFFSSVDAEVKDIRWLHHKDSGDFKGCGYVEFWSTEACDKAATLNGKNLLGRPIRIDWTD